MTYQPSQSEPVFYKAVGNEIRDSSGKQIAVILPVGCTKKLAREMAAYAAQQANHEARRKALQGKDTHAR